jgi:UDP-glucuronate 4-epimerase
MRVLLTGAAGFIGYHAVKALLEAGHEVLGVDSLVPYYDPVLKRERLADLAHPRFRFEELDVADHDRLKRVAGQETQAILHLAAQAGVRYSLENPFAYERSNLAGHLSVLEYARGLPKLQHLVYASSSSVYGERTETPFRETDRCDAPASLYAATKRAAELMSETYSRLYDIPQTGLRFFTVYGPFGRPDMAYWTFLEDILNGRPITLFNRGRMERDFTFIGDVAPALTRVLERPPAAAPRHVVYNIGNHQPVALARFVAAIEKASERSAEIRLGPMQPGDVTRTFADISRAQRDLGFYPSTSIEDGMLAFVQWRLAHIASRRRGAEEDRKA